MASLAKPLVLDHLGREVVPGLDLEPAERDMARQTILLRSAHRPGAPPPVELSVYTVSRGYLVSTIDDLHRIGMVLGSPSAVSWTFTGEPMRREVMSEGDLYIRPAGQPTTWFDEATTTFLGIELSDAFVRRLAAETGAAPVAFEPRVKFRDLGIERIGRLLMSELEQGEPNGSLFTDGLATALAGRLISAYGGRNERPAVTSALSGRRLKRVLEFIEANLEEPLSLERIAEVAIMSPSHFKALFRRAMGTPLHQYVIARRVERARLLLAAGEMSITEVAFQVGFAHQSHLARWTRRLTGATPSELMGRGLR